MNDQQKPQASMNHERANGEVLQAIVHLSFNFLSRRYLGTIHCTLVSSLTATATHSLTVTELTDADGHSFVRSFVRETNGL